MRWDQRHLVYGAFFVSLCIYFGIAPCSSSLDFLNEEFCSRLKQFVAFKSSASFTSQDFWFVPLPNGQMLAIGINDLFTGLLITFIGWLIDEARKIREEQELTV